MQRLRWKPKRRTVLLLLSILIVLAPVLCIAVDAIYLNWTISNRISGSVVDGLSLLWRVLPGVPVAGSEEDEAFTLAFWSALYSGILASLCTGVIAGLLVSGALWWAQERAEKHAVRREYEREVALLQERTRSILTQANPTVIARAINSEPRPAKAITELLITQPIELWRATLPAPYPFLDTLRELQRAHTTFVVAATSLDFHLRQLIRHYNASEDRDTLYDEEMHFYCVGHIQGAAPADTFRWIDSPLLSFEELEEAFARASGQPLIQQQAQSYLDAKRRVLEPVEVLRTLLNIP